MSIVFGLLSASRLNDRETFAMRVGKKVRPGGNGTFLRFLRKRGMLAGRYLRTKKPPLEVVHFLERDHGFEPRPEAWKAAVLPLHQSRRQELLLKTRVKWTKVDFGPGLPAYLWSRRLDSNQRPLGPKPSTLPACATPRRFTSTLQLLLVLLRSMVTRLRTIAHIRAACKPPQLIQMA
jgi:hypothetical protein